MTRPEHEAWEPRSSNGKSTLLDVFASLFDESVVTSIQPKDWKPNEFMVETMQYSRLNKVDDMSYQRISDTGLGGIFIIVKLILFKGNFFIACV